LTMLEMALARFVRLNFCLAELMGPPSDKEAVTETLSVNAKMLGSFPEIQKVFTAIDIMRRYHEDRRLSYTEIEEAFFRYLSLAELAGCKISGKANDNSAS